MKKLIVPLLMFALISCTEKTQPGQTQEYKVSKAEMLTFGDSTKTLLPEAEFWEIISLSGKNGKKNYEGQIQELSAVLAKKSPDYIQRFANTFYLLLNGSYNWNLWAAAYIINGGCSDDCFEYFREYLISKGKSKFYATLKDPDSCAEWILTESKENWEGISRVPLQVYKAKTGQELNLNLPPRKEPAGEPFDEFLIGKQYPKLADRFNYN